MYLKHGGKNTTGNANQNIQFALLVTNILIIRLFYLQMWNKKPRNTTIGASYTYTYSYW